MSAERLPGYVAALRFRALTALYDPVVAWTTREQTFKARLLDRAELQAGERLLDVGCGTGTLLVAAAEREPGLKLVGLDGDPDVLARAAAKAAAAGAVVELHQGDAGASRLADGSFDVVLSSLIFHHLTVPSKARAIAEISRMLRPGGRVVVADWGRPADPGQWLGFALVRLLDGTAVTRGHREDIVATLLAEQFADVRETDVMRTVFGTLRIWSAWKK